MSTTTDWAAVRADFPAVGPRNVVDAFAWIVVRIQPALHNLITVKVGANRILERSDEEGGYFAFGCLR